MAPEAVSGSFWFLFAFDVCDEIRLETLRGREDGPAAGPEAVQFERPPVMERLGPMAIPGGGRLHGELNYYDYGVISVKLEMPFRLTWAELVAGAGAMMENPDAREHAEAAVRDRIGRVGEAMVRPRETWLDEEYVVIHVDSGGWTAEDLIARHGAEIAQIVRGERTALASGEVAEMLGSRLSYYPNDLMVAGWTGTFLLDTAAGAASAVRLLEYANAQLLEFRYYDQVLTRVLEGVYDSLERGGGLFRRWRMGLEARRLNTLLLEVRELTERADTAIKFLSDMYSARVYRLAAERIGVGDYRRLVDAKLHTAAELYRFMMDQFHAGRAFVLELMVVIILVIELIYLFRGVG